MPDDGWSEPWPRREVDDLGVWDRFVEQLDLQQLLREQAPVGGDLQAERFGSRQHHEMVHAHEYIARDLREQRDAALHREALEEAHEYNVREHRARRQREQARRGHAA